jgi:hypothetical protein
VYVHSEPPGVARVPAGRYAPVRDTGARCGRAHATPGIAAGLAVRSADSLIPGADGWGQHVGACVSEAE